MHNTIKNDLRNIFSGKSKIRFGTAIQAVASYLSDGTPTSSKNSNTKHFKKQETEKLEIYISERNLWKEIDFSQYVSEGVVEQSYFEITEPTDLNIVRKFLKQNGFQNNRNNDYFNSELGIIIEDLHDENVLTRNGILYFIDTVFYITDEFN